MARSNRALWLLVAALVLLVAHGCSYDSGLGDVTCDDEGVREDGRVCKDGYWVAEDQILDGGDDSESDADAEQPDVLPDTSDTEEDTDGDDCVPTTDDETTCDQIDNDCDGEIDEGLTTSYYFDEDEDGFGDPLQTVDRCDPPPGNYVENAEDCNDDDAEVNPDISEECISEGNCPYCNGRDDNCDGEADENCPCDPDGDFETQCFPFGSGDPEVGECSWGTRDCVDGTFTQCTGAAGPNPETCDSLDNDCDGDVDEGVKTTFYRDSDGDGVGTDDDTRRACSAPNGYVATSGDCDDSDDTISPNASESCNQIDDDCDGDTDEGVTTTYYLDDDNDDYGVSNNTTEACSEPNGYASQSGDCDDSDNNVNPGESESCNNVDDNCDGNVDEGVQTTYYLDSDDDNYGDSSSTQDACSEPNGYTDNPDDCDDSNDAINPGESESCNNVDDDCDGDIDEGVTDTFYEDSDGDGYGNANSTQNACSAPSGYVDDDEDCDDSDDAINPDGTESCNGADDDCDGDVDEGVQTTFYRDADKDGYGDSSTTKDDCSAPTGYVADDTDCDDEDPTTYPGAPEICDDRDNDCAGGNDDTSNAWCNSQSSISPGSNTVVCDSDDAPDGGPCCETQSDGDDTCEIETRCETGSVDDDEDGDANCADVDCDGLYCAPGKVCNHSTGNCEAI